MLIKIKIDNMGLFGALAGAIGRKNKGGQSDTSKPFHTHSSKSNNQTAAGAIGGSGGAAPMPDPSKDSIVRSGGRQDQPNNFVSNKSQELGAELFEGQQMVEQRNQIKSIRSSPVPVPGSQDENLSNYGSNFTSPMNQGEKVNDTIYKRNGNQMNKMDFNKIINSNDSTIKNTRRHNDSVSARADSIDKMFPMESSSMKEIMTGRKLKKEINKGRKSKTKGIQSGSFTREVKGKEIDRRSYNTIG